MGIATEANTWMLHGAGQQQVLVYSLTARDSHSRRRSWTRSLTTCWWRRRSTRAATQTKRWRSPDQVSCLLKGQYQKIQSCTYSTLFAVSLSFVNKADIPSLLHKKVAFFLSVEKNNVFFLPCLVSNICDRSLAAFLEQFRRPYFSTHWRLQKHRQSCVNFF